MEYKVGDIIGFSGFSRDSILINLLTYGLPFWSISHVGIIGEYEGEKLLFESTVIMDVPCVIQKKPFRGVQAVKLEDRLASYKGRAWHYPVFRQLYDAEANRLNKFLVNKVGITYDKVGGMRSAGIGLSWVESKLRGEDLSSLFCSELIAASHRRIGLLRTDNASRWSPNKIVRYERRKRTLLRPRRIL